MNYGIFKNNAVFTKSKFRFCTLHLFICGDIRPWRQGYADKSLIGRDEWLQVCGRQNQMVCCGLHSRPSAGQQHDITYLQMSTPPPPPPSLLLISVSGCAAADPSLFETRRELMVMSQLPPPKAASQAHDFLCRTQAPFVRPQVTHDPWTPSPTDPLG